MDTNPAPAYAAEEQARGDNLVTRIGEITADPSHPSHGSTWMWQAAAQNAYGNAANHTEQPS